MLKFFLENEDMIAAVVKLLQFKQITRKIFSGLRRDSNPLPLS